MTEKCSDVFFSPPLIFQRGQENYNYPGFRAVNQSWRQNNPYAQNKNLMFSYTTMKVTGIGSAVSK